jgi:hypothetical protein
MIFFECYFFHNALSFFADALTIIPSEHKKDATVSNPQKIVAKTADIALLRRDTPSFHYLPLDIYHFCGILFGIVIFIAR